MQISEINDTMALVIMGHIFREYRERMGRSQAEICKMIGYKNPNYITMVETGRTKLPINKVLLAAKKYDLGKYGVPFLVKMLYPEVWSIILQILKDNSEDIKSKTLLNYDKDIDEELLMIIRENKLEKFMQS
ncbi:MAG: helix-turn-helix transcriptional regulator [Desulfobacterales bacterium]|nr:helix-turn-helix transcriptional regulator [Desulfobacterales bacterium]